MTLSPEQIDEVADALNAAVLSDCLDQVGCTGQILSARLRPLDPAMRVVGVAATILISETFVIPPDPYRGMLETIDAAQVGSVMVIVSATQRCAVWGELFSTAAQARGLRGTLIDGYSRDTERIIAEAYPVFAVWSKPIDMAGRGQFLSAGDPVEIDGVRIAPGDLVFGDRDGVVVVPAGLADEVIARAYAKIGKEGLARAALRRGVRMQQVWEDHGVL